MLINIMPRENRNSGRAKGVRGEDQREGVLATARERASTRGYPNGSYSSTAINAEMVLA